MDFLNNTNIVVAIGFLIFVGVVVYFRVPKMIAAQLDARADGIKSDIDEARNLREEAQQMLASFERKQKEALTHADDIVAAARKEAEQAAELAKADIAKSVERRLHTATEQIEAAEKAAIDQIKSRAASIAVASASELIRENMTETNGSTLLDDAIKEVQTKLH